MRHPRLRDSLPDLKEPASEQSGKRAAIQSVGDDRAGFSLSFDVASNTVHVLGWGFWSTEVAMAFPEAVREACRVRVKPALVLDMNELKPMREEGQRCFGNLIGALRGLALSSAVIRTQNQLTRLQLVRIVAERSAKDCVRFV
jgi:hypothetical protein